MGTQYAARCMHLLISINKTDDCKCMMRKQNQLNNCKTENGINKFD